MSEYLPPRPKQSFVMASENSFDSSGFIFVGVTSLLAEGTNTHPQLGKLVAGFGRYYWRGFLDKTDGNYLVMWALPIIGRGAWIFAFLLCSRCGFRRNSGLWARLKAGQGPSDHGIQVRLNKSQAFANDQGG